MATSQDATTQDQGQQQQPWHAAFPSPRLEPGVMPKQRAQMVLSMKIASMLIIDVRRTDYEGGAIRGSLNVPAQGFWWNRGDAVSFEFQLLHLVFFFLRPYLPSAK